MKPQLWMYLNRRPSRKNFGSNVEPMKEPNFATNSATRILYVERKGSKYKFNLNGRSELTLCIAGRNYDIVCQYEPIDV